jgi:hypothetical protein
VRRENLGLGKMLDSTWRPIDSAWLAEHAPTPDDQAGEGDFSLGIRFPYDLKQAKNRGIVVRGYPAADRAVLALARGALHELPNDAAHDHPLLLTLSLSAFDYVGHVHGPDSWESWEMLRELDQSLADFLAELEQRFGPRLSILLTADHGSVVLPETAGNERARPWCNGSEPDPFERPCTKGERLFRDELELLLQKAARAALGPGDWIRGVVEPFAYFTPAALALSAPRRAALEGLRSARSKNIPASCVCSCAVRLRALARHRPTTRSKPWFAAHCPKTRGICTSCRARAASSIPTWCVLVASTMARPTSTIASCRYSCALPTARMRARFCHSACVRPTSPPPQQRCFASSLHRAPAAGATCRNSDAEEPNGCGAAHVSPVELV